MVYDKNISSFDPMDVPVINLSAIIEKTNIDPKELACQLFPGHKHPKMALDRVLSGEGVLDERQISRLSHFTGIPVGDLFTNSEWKVSIEDNVYTLECGQFKAKLDPRFMSTKLYHRHTLYHGFIIHSSSITLGEYIARLEFEISKLNKK